MRNDNKIAKATITMPVLSKLTLSGASKFNTNDQFDCGKNRFVMKLSGASLVYGLNVVAKEAQVSISGASTVRDLKGDFLGPTSRYPSKQIVWKLRQTNLTLDFRCIKSRGKWRIRKVDLECSGLQRHSFPVLLMKYPRR